MNENIKRIQKAIDDLKNGKMIILTDDLKRENEGDLIFPAENTTPEKINFMLRHCTGIICLSMPAEKLNQLSLPLMVPAENNTSSHRTPFTVSIEARKGVSTGVSAEDRANTILTAIHDNAKSDDLVRPGHIFPLKAQNNGVLARAGHTEGSLDIVKLAGFKSAAVLCEVMNTDGTMCRGQQLQEFADQHNLTILSIDDIIHYRRSHENLIAKTASANLPLKKYGHFSIHVLDEKYVSKEHVLLMNDKFQHNKPPLVRIHSGCITGDIFGSQRCDCQDQLHYSLEQISVEGGLLIYLNQEGRGIGLFNKIKSYALQEQGMDTVEANHELGCSVDLRNYYIAANILRNLNIHHIRLLTNNPHKISNLQEYSNLTIDREPLPIFSNEFNKKYILTKQIKLKHYS